MPYFPTSSIHRRACLAHGLRVGWCLLMAGLIFLATASRGTAGEPARIWSAVLLASNSSQPKALPPQLQPVAGRLQRVFGYNQYEVYGSASKSWSDNSERWLVPSQNFYLGLQAKRVKNDEFFVSLELFHDKRRLVTTEARLGPKSPLFIRGPRHPSGHVIVVVMIEP